MISAAIIDWVLQTGLMVSLLIGIVLVIRRPVARYVSAGAAYALWLLPLARLFMPQMTLPFIRRPDLDLPDPTVEVRTSYETVPPIEVIPRTTEMLPMASRAALFDESEPAMSNASALSEKALTLPDNFDTAFLMIAIWLSFAIVWLTFQLIKQSNFMKAMKIEARTTPYTLDGPISDAMGLVGLRKRPDIRLSARVQGPMVTGIMSPLILLPLDFETRFKPAQQGFALVHEMAHIKRGDLWAALITLIFRALFWPNPLVHYAAHKMRVDQEAACDASVVAKTGGASAAHSYAETLVHAAKSAGQANYKAPLGLALSDSPKKSGEK